MSNKNSPFLLLINGPIGSGKTTLADYLKYKLKRPCLFLDIDNLRYYFNFHKKTWQHHNFVRSVIIDIACGAIKKNLNVVIASSWPLKFFSIAKKEIKNAKIVHIFLSTSLENVLRRIQERKRLKRMLKKSKVIKNYSYYSNQKSGDAMVIDANKSIPTVRKHVLQILKENKIN